MQVKHKLATKAEQYRRKGRKNRNDIHVKGIVVYNN